MTDNMEAAGQGYDYEREPRSARAWHARIADAEKVFRDYQTHADRLDRLYADLNRLASDTRDREFQLFWANCEVLKPSIYARPPVPVVVPRFKDRRPLYRTASEFLERACVVSFDLARINDVMLLIRDDLAVVGRGVSWVRYETKEDGYECIRIEHIDRKDFLHEPARNWCEVGWVARRAWLTKAEMRKRFGADHADGASYIVRKDERDQGAADNEAKCGIWEIWSKDDDRCFWISEGVNEFLDEGKPHLKLEGFFPTPKPAYATLQRGSLIPVPDAAFYKDQLEEVNQLTARIHALADAVQVRGFYPAGASEIKDAVETALKMLDNRQVLVPVSNWAAFGSGGDPILWLPIEMIATTIASLVELRRQVIDDVYQIMGLSDIMRGATEASETATAQQLKSQYGSVRVRDKQAEMVRVARDLVAIAAEIMAETFGPGTLSQMAQMDLPTDTDIKRRVSEIEAEQQRIAEGVKRQLAEAEANPEVMARAQQNPKQAQQVVAQVQQQAQQQIAQLAGEARKLAQTITVDQVMKFLRDQRIRPYILDIETDSTIQPDEDAEKQRRAEFLTALGGAVRQLGELVSAVPQSAPFAAELLKFAIAPFRAGRELDVSIDEFADQILQRARQPQPDPQAEAAKVELQLRLIEIRARIEETRLKGEIEREKARAEAEARAQESALAIKKLEMEIAARAAAPQETESA